MSPLRQSNRRPTDIGRALLRRWPLPVPVAGSKDERGRILIVGGAPQMPGPVILAGIGALRAGAGKLQIATSESIAQHVGAAVLEALVVGMPQTSSGAIASGALEEIVRRSNAADAVVIGPGMVDEDACAALVASVCAQLQIAAVIDAAALACVRNGDDALRALDGCAIPPHAGEMAGMLAVPKDDVESEPARHVTLAAQRFGAVVALKGAQTYIATPDGEVYCNRHGTVGLATSGSGDTLAGIIGGLLARGMAPLHAACWGVFVHAEAGARLTRRVGIGFLARELLAEIPPLLRG
ncbi:MAG: NAD(P)H-hydrate dehydratase [Vulcanimicrobiaceae bacterium]